MMNTLMKSIIRTAITCTALAVCTAGASAQSANDAARPYLKSQASVSGNVVRIGDLVANAGIVANVAVFRAPDLGKTGIVPTDQVLEAVRAHALVGLDTNGVSEVVVTRASREIPVREIEELVSRALSARFNLGAAEEITVIFEREPRALQVDANAKGEPRVDRLTYDTRGGRFDVALEIPTGPNQTGMLRLSGRAAVTSEVVMVSRAIERGAVVTEADLVIERRPRAEIGRDAIATIAQAAGMAARGVLRPGQPLRSADLMKPEVIARNQLVTLVYEVPGITLTFRGKAAEGGAEGDTISVLNEQSKRTVQGVIVGPGHVMVLSPSPRLSANLAAHMASNSATPTASDR